MDTLSLIAEPFTFTQFRPLLPRQVIGEAKQCGVWLSDQELEAWHRVRLLVPFYRLARDGREIAAAHRRGEDAYYLAHWQPTSRADLVDARRHGRLHDASSEPFIARHRLKRRLGDWSYETSVYLYSRHQLAALQLLRGVRPHLKLRRAQGHLVGRLDAGADVVAIWRERASGLRDAAIAATLLEPAYYSRVFHRLSLPREEDFVAFDRWRRKRRVLSPLRVLGVDAGWIKETAEMLHWEASRVDPLGAWAEVVGAGEPEKWKSLSGDARAELVVVRTLSHQRSEPQSRSPSRPKILQRKPRSSTLAQAWPRPTGDTLEPDSSTGGSAP